MIGAFAMWLISWSWMDKIEVIGILATATGAVILGLWRLHLRIETVRKV